MTFFFGAKYESDKKKSLLYLIQDVADFFLMTVSISSHPVTGHTSVGVMQNHSNVIHNSFSCLLQMQGVKSMEKLFLMSLVV